MTLFGEIGLGVGAVFSMGIIALFFYLCIDALAGTENEPFGIRTLLFLWFLRQAIFILWLMFSVSVFGSLWVKVAGPENVPQWAVTLFQTYEKGESQCLTN